MGFFYLESTAMQPSEEGDVWLDQFEFSFLGNFAWLRSKSFGYRLWPLRTRGEKEFEPMDFKRKTTKFCMNCGGEIDYRAELCPKCGVRQPYLSSSTGKIRLGYSLPDYLLELRSSHHRFNRRHSIFNKVRPGICRKIRKINIAASITLACL